MGVDDGGGGSLDECGWVSFRSDGGEEGGSIDGVCSSFSGIVVIGQSVIQSWPAVRPSCLMSVFGSFLFSILCLEADAV